MILETHGRTLNTVRDIKQAQRLHTNREGLRVIIVDDEPPGRQKVREMLKSEREIEVVAECANGHEAVNTIRAQSPDLVFLDIQMPGLDGFGVLEALGADHLPAVIFVTAYDQYALRAFEVHAVDYLLKPFDKERFQSALRRAKVLVARESQEDTRQRLLSLLATMRAGKKRTNRLAVKSGGKVFFLKTEEIDWIEAAGNYIRVHSGNEAHLLRETMGAIQTKLDPDQFIRIHRSTFVNIEKVKELQPWFHGEYVVILRDGTQLTMSRSYRSNLPELLGKSL